MWSNVVECGHVVGIQLISSFISLTTVYKFDTVYKAVKINLKANLLFNQAFD